MNFSNFFIDRPIFAGVLSVLIFLVGLLALRGDADLGISRGRAAQVVVRAQLSGRQSRR